MKHTYNNWSTKIFEGFYNSGLYNDDIIYNIERNDRDEGYLKENEGYDIEWDSFTNEVTDYAVYELLNTLSDNSIIKDMKLKKLCSPKYYNYETDSLIIDMDLNLRNLKTYCLKEHADEFNKYLKKNFTSYDGFMSFVDNNIRDFINTYKNNTDKTREIDVMIEYYLLTQINNSLDCDNFDYDNSYQYSMYEHANEVIYNNLKKVSLETV